MSALGGFPYDIIRFIAALLESLAIFNDENFVGSEREIFFNWWILKVKSWILKFDEINI